MISAEFAQRRVGQRIDGRYELRALLGVGVSGAVYEARHEYTERVVAVKVMHQQLLHDETAVSRFQREARTVAKLRHPSIVRLLDAGQTDGWPYIVMERLRGETMGRTLLARRLDVGEVVRIGLDVLAGLSAAHEAGVVHRDLKPDNVLLMEEVAVPWAKLLDFGVAKNLRSSGTSGVLTQPGAAIGSPHYMSPEQARAAPLDPRTDVWSAGALLFHALVGRPPFDAPHMLAVLMKLVSERPPRVRDALAGAPEGLARAIDGALEPELDARWASAERMAEALRT